MNAVAKRTITLTLDCHDTTLIFLNFQEKRNWAKHLSKMTIGPNRLDFVEAKSIAAKIAAYDNGFLPGLDFRSSLAIKLSRFFAEIIENNF